MLDTQIYAQRGGLTGLYSGKGPILDEWEISTDDVIVEQLLGEGAFGEVYKGVIRGPLENPKISAVLRQAIGVPVAIKLLKSEFVFSCQSLHVLEKPGCYGFESRPKQIQCLNVFKQCLSK